MADRAMGVSLKLLSLASDPGTASAGDLYWNTNTAKVRVYNGTAWIDAGGSSGGRTFATFTA